MSLSDPIADLLTRLRNAVAAKHRYIDFQPSKIKINIIKVLVQQGFMDNYLVDDENRKARAFIKYADGREPLITDVKRISKPGIRRYINYKKIPKLDGGMGLVILSTPNGIIDGESARKMKVGGELLCYVW